MVFRLSRTEISGVITDIRSAVMDGNSYYFIQLEGDPTYYSISAAQNREVVTLNVGDQVTIDHAVPATPDESAVAKPSSILDGYSLTINARKSEDTVLNASAIELTPDQGEAFFSGVEGKKLNPQDSGNAA